MINDRRTNTREFWRVWEQDFSSGGSVASVLPKFGTIRDGVVGATQIGDTVALRLAMELSLGHSSPWVIPFVAGVCAEMLAHNARPFELLHEVFDGNFQSTQPRFLELVRLSETLWWTAASRVYQLRGSPTTADHARKNLHFLDVLVRLCSQDILLIPHRLSVDDWILQEAEVGRLTDHFDLDFKHVSQDCEPSACFGGGRKRARSDLTETNPFVWEVKDLVNHLLERSEIAPVLILKILFRSGGLGAAFAASPLRESICEALEKGDDASSETRELVPIVNILFRLFALSLYPEDKNSFSSLANLVVADVAPIAKILSRPELTLQWKTDCQHSLGELVQRSTTT